MRPGCDLGSSLGSDVWRVSVCWGVVCATLQCLGLASCSRGGPGSGAEPQMMAGPCELGRARAGSDWCGICGGPLGRHTCETLVFCLHASLCGGNAAACTSQWPWRFGLAGQHRAGPVWGLTIPKLLGIKYVLSGNNSIMCIKHFLTEVRNVLMSNNEAIDTNFPYI
jgi:hypothetical protein